MIAEFGGFPEDESEGDELADPEAVMVGEDKQVYVADTNNHRILVYDADGVRTLSFGSQGDEPGSLDKPSDIRVTSDGVIYVADRDNTRVQRFAPDGRPLGEFILHASDDAGIEGGDIAIEDSGYLLICNAIKHTLVRVQLLDTAGDGE